MGRKTDIGVLSTYMTADTRDFTKALGRASGQAKVFKMKVQGSINAIGGSFTELNSKISFFGSAAAGAFGVGAGAIEGFNLALEPTAANAEKLADTLGKLPMGIGEATRMLEMFIRATGVFEVQVEQLDAATQKMLDSTTKALATVRRSEAIDKQTGSLMDQLFNLTADPKDIIKRDFDRARNAIRDQVKGIRDEMSRLSEEGPEGYERRAFQQEIDALFKQLDIMEKIHDQKRATIYEQQLQSWLDEDAVAKAARLKKIEDERLKTQKEQSRILKERQKLEKAIAAQQEKVRLAESQNWTGATATISTAIGSMKVGSESQTLAIQKRIMEETAKEVSILQDMRTIMQNQGAGALT